MKNFLGGIALLCIGMYLLLSNIHVTTLGFYSFGRVNTGGILLVLLLIFVVLAFMKPNVLTCGLVGLDILLVIISVIAGTHFTLRYMSAFELIAMLLMFASGLGLTLRALLLSKKDKES